MRWNTHSSKRDPPQPSSSTAGAVDPGTGQDVAGGQAAGPTSAGPGQAREAAERWVRQEGTRH